MNLPASLCYALAVAFLGPLRKFGSRTPALKRFDSHEEYFEQRVADISRYKKLFAPHASFAGKTVLDLGCNRGYLLHGFLQQEKFNAIGADLVSYYLKDARRDYGDIIQFVETTPTSIPVPDNSVDIVYTIDTIEHLSNSDGTAGRPASAPPRVCPAPAMALACLSRFHAMCAWPGALWPA